MSVIPRTGASIILFLEGKVLLVKRGKDPYKGYWSLPGGTQKPGELLEDTARRELQEETGIIAEELSFCVVRDRLKHDENGTLKFHYVLATYFANRFSGTAKAADDAEAIGWFNDTELNTLQTTPETPTLIRDVLQARSIRLQPE